VPQERTSLDILRGRRSVRRFEDRPLPEEAIEQLVEAASSAPSAHNAQPWRFVAVAPGEARERLARAMAPRFRADLGAEGASPARIAEALAAGGRRVVEAPGLLVVCLDEGALVPQGTRRRGRIERMLGVQGVAAAVTTLLLAAHVEGIGGFWLSAPLFVPGTVRRALSLPAAWDPQAMVLLGYPAGSGKERERRPLDDVFHRRS